MQIKIDTQERAKIPLVDKYIKLMDKKLKFVKGYKIEKLATGDYATPDGFIGIERKGTDLIESVYSGLLKQQLKELRENYKRPYLFVEFNGVDEIAEHFNIAENQVIGLMASCNSKSRVPFISCGKWFVPLMVKTIDKAYEGKEIDIEREYIPARRSSTKKEFKTYMLASIPGIHIELARRILKHFDGSISRVMQASIEDLQKVDGIAEGKAKKIKEIFK